jgi:hypothetical protein
MVLGFFKIFLIFVFAKDLTIWLFATEGALSLSSYSILDVFSNLSPTLSNLLTYLIMFTVRNTNYIKTQTDQRFTVRVEHLWWTRIQRTKM